jgi:hypothetical protein
MRILAALAIACTISISAAVGAEKTEKVAYPTAEKPSFIITVPTSWKMTAAEEEGDYFHLTGPTGAVYSFRTIEGSERSLDRAIKASLKDIETLFSDVEIGDAQDWKPDGLTGLYAVGTGKDKEDGAPVKIGLGWCALKDGSIAEMWFVADADDTKGMTAAEAIANSLNAPDVEETE